MHRLLPFVFAVALAGCIDQEAQTQACADAILEIDLKKAEAVCDPLPHDAQDKAAKIATEKSGVVIFLPPYEAKQARAGY